MGRRQWSGVLLVLGVGLGSRPALAEVLPANPPTQFELRQHEGAVLQTAQALGQIQSAQPPEPSAVIGSGSLLEEVNVTANRREAATFRTPESLSVISRDEIESMLPLAQNLTGLLHLVPGVQTGLGTSPLEANVSIRGLGDDRSPVLIDGERQNVSQGEIREDLFSVDLRDIERVEILRGSASGTYGSDTTGGLINIITRQPGANSSPKLEYQGYFGGYSTYHQGLRFTAGGDKFSLALSGTYHNTDDYFDAAGNFVPNQQDYQTYTGRVSIFPDADNRITLKYSAYRFHSALLAISDVPEEAAGLPLASKDRFGIEWTSRNIFGSTTDLKLSAYYNQLFQNFSQQVFETDAEGERELVFGNTSTIRINTVGTNFQLSTPIGSARLTYGLDFFQENGTNSTLTTSEDEGTGEQPLVPDGRQTGLAGYLFLDYPIIPELQLSAGVRYDSFKSEGFPVSSFYGTGTSFSGQSIDESAVTPKVGLVWNFTPGLRLRANYSQGFRVPTIKERFFQGFAGPLNAEIEDIVIGGEAPPFIILQGNPNLTSERTTSWEVGFGGNLGRASFDVVYFNNSVSGLLNARQIGEDDDGVPIFQFGNIQNARIQGIEVQSIVQFDPQWRLRGVFSWTDAIDSTTRQQLASVVPTFGTLQLRYLSPGGWLALLQARAASSRIGAGSYGTVDLNFGVPIGAGLQLTLTATNLFNTLYRESLIGFNAPGPQLFVGLSTRDGGE